MNATDITNGYKEKLKYDITKEHLLTLNRYNTFIHYCQTGNHETIKKPINDKPKKKNPPREFKFKKLTQSGFTISNLKPCEKKDEQKTS